MRFHVPALPGRPPLRENSSCAYSGYVRKFCRMMVERGHDVTLYTGARSDAPAAEVVRCYPASEPLPFDRPDLWADANQRAIDHIGRRAGAGDFLCLIDGTDQRGLMDALPDLMPVEYRVAYGGTTTEHRVFETYAWMHVVYGAQYGAHTADGHFFDCVIPPPFEVEDFPAGDGDGGYLLYLGRMDRRKGCLAAAQIAEAAGVELLLAGEGPDAPDYGTRVGHVGPDERAGLLGGARAILAPSLYVEPGGGAAIEAQLCGTPAITTDWGCYVETVVQGQTGFRCRTLGEFLAAIDRAGDLDRGVIRRRAIDTYGLDAIAPQYERYFEQLSLLWGDGWNDVAWEGLSRLGGAPAPVG